jgi:hypothetical protein
MTTRQARTIRILATAGAVAAGMFLTPGLAHATDGPFTWCPGQTMDRPIGPDTADTAELSGTHYAWDMNVCHTWYKVGWGYGNVLQIHDQGASLSGSSVWEGDNPPGANPSGVNCSPFWCPAPPLPDPNFHP